MNDYDFGERLYRLRREKGLTQTELGALLGVSSKAVSKWENGVSYPHTGTLKKLAALLEVSVESLLKESAAPVTAEETTLPDLSTGAPLPQPGGTAPLPGSALSRGIWRILSVLMLSLAAGSYTLSLFLPGGLWWLCLLALLLPPLIRPALYTAAYPRRLKICGNGAELLILFLASTAVVGVPQLLLAFYMLPGQWVPWAIGTAVIVAVEAVAFWCGILRVYFTSAQLGFRWRIWGIICGMIPVAQLVVLCRIIRVTMQEAAFESARRRREEARASQRICKTRYPLLMIHGVFFRDSKLLNYWGRVPEALKANGATVFYGNHQSAASVEVGAKELAARIRAIVEETGCQKVNIIAHSKGGLECRYALAHLDVAPLVASLTTVNTPHRGCSFADYLLKKAPDSLKNEIARHYNNVFGMLGDHDPDFLSAVNDLTAEACKAFDAATPPPAGVFCQSVGSRLNRPGGGRFPLNLSSRLAGFFDGPNDGLVGQNAFEWGQRYTLLTARGRRGISHGDMIDLNRENLPELDVREFYVGLVSDLKQRGL